MDSFLTILCVILEVRKDCRSRAVIRKVFFIKRWFFRMSLTRDDLSEEGKVPVKRERLIIEKIVEYIISYFLKNGSWNWIEFKNVALIAHTNGSDIRF